MPILALTISPPLREGNQIELFKRDLKRFAKLKVWFSLYPEFSDTGRLHYHGFIAKTILDKYLKDIEYLQEKFGFICVKPVKNQKGWEAYCKKEWAVTKKYLGIKCSIDSFTISKLTDTNENPFDQYIGK